MPLMRTLFAAVTVTALAAAASAKPLTLPAETNLRAAPGTKSEILTLMPKGSEVEVGECDAGWCKVKFGDKDGFAIGRNLGDAPPQSTAAATPSPRQQADLGRLRRGYEQYFDDDPQNDVTGSVTAPRTAQAPRPQYAPPQNRQPQDDDDYYDDDDFDDDGPAVAYVPAPPPPIYYSYRPYPRGYYGYGPYYYRRW